MNFVGHINVAISHQAVHGPEHQDDAYLIGAALPDIAAMGRFRLTAKAVDTSVRAGVQLHHRTDDLFHRHPWFRVNSQAVTAKLEQLNLPRGAARACGHVGIELLLDGFLLESDARLGTSAARAMANVQRRDLGLDRMVDPAHRTDWQLHLSRTSSWGLPGDYRDPAAVAERLRRILARRPRLSFDTARVTAVAQVLAEQQTTIESGAADLLADLGVRLSEPAAG